VVEAANLVRENLRALPIGPSGRHDCDIIGPGSGMPQGEIRIRERVDLIFAGQNLRQPFARSALRVGKENIAPSGPVQGRWGQPE
jgi:hypothetical protein